MMNAWAWTDDDDEDHDAHDDEEDDAQAVMLTELEALAELGRPTR